MHLDRKVTVYEARVIGLEDSAALLEVGNIGPRLVFREELRNLGLDKINSIVAYLVFENGNGKRDVILGIYNEMSQKSNE